jgi:hypothetical protein
VTPLHGERTERSERGETVKAGNATGRITGSFCRSPAVNSVKSDIPDEQLR